MAVTSRLRPPGAGVPFAEEVEYSRLGITVGPEGAQNVNRIWRVYTASARDNPVKTMLNLASKDGGVRLRESFPKDSGWGDGSYVLLYLTLIDHWQGTNVWTVRGDYGPPFLLNYPSKAWDFDIQGSLETEHVFTDLRGKAVGPPRYVPSKDPTPFSVRLPDRPEPIYLTLGGGGTDPFSDHLARYMEGMDRPRRLSVLRLTKVIPDWNFPAVLASQLAMGMVNIDAVSVFTSASPIAITFAESPGDELGPDGVGIHGQLMLVDTQVTPMNVGSDFTGTGPVGIGPSFRIVLVFKFDPLGWQYKRRHTYKAENGDEAQIKRDSKFIDETFIRADLTAISDIIGGFV